VGIPVRLFDPQGIGLDAQDLRSPHDPVRAVAVQGDAIGVRHGHFLIAM
jgi:hypothetical protein